MCPGEGMELKSWGQFCHSGVVKEATGVQCWLVGFSLPVVSYKCCRCPLPSEAFPPKGNPSGTTLDGVCCSSALPRALPSDQMALENQVFKISVRKPISFSPSIPYSAAGTGKTLCSQHWMLVSVLTTLPPTPMPWANCSGCRWVLSSDTEYLLLRDLYSRGVRFVLLSLSTFFFSIPCI